ncbi:MAG: EF-hand domain-containing protein [Candidatus Obscuribacterales bacterium]
MTLSIIPISLGTGFSYLLVATIYLIVCYILIKTLKKAGNGKTGIFLAAGLCVIMILQISHWYKLEVEREKQKSELIERSPEIYTLLSDKFQQFDKNQDGQIDAGELAHYKTTCSCNAATVSYLNAKLQSIGDLRAVSGSDSLMFTINREDLEALKGAALESFQMTQ